MEGDPREAPLQQLDEELTVFFGQLGICDVDAAALSAFLLGRHVTEVRCVNWAR